MKKNMEAIKAALAEPDEFGIKHLFAQRVLDMEMPKFFISVGPKPDHKYFQYFLKITFDQRYWDHERPWDAGYTYELPDGRVQIWCGPDGAWRVYEYEDIGKTGDWLLD